MDMLRPPSHIPDDFRKIIYSNNPDFPRKIFDIVASEDEEKIEELCEWILFIQENFWKDFDFWSIASWFENEHFHIQELIDFLWAYWLPRFITLKPKIIELLKLSENKMSFADIYKEWYNPEEVLSGMIWSLSHGRKTYPESYKDVVRDIVKKTGVITLGHGEQWIFRQILRHGNGTIGFKTYHYDQKQVLKKEFDAQRRSYEMILDAKDDGLLPEYIYPISTVGSLSRAQARNKLWKQVVQNAITLEELQDLNKLRGRQGWDHPKIRNFLRDMKNQFRGIGINPYDTDTPKNVMVGEETWKKIIQFCQENRDIELDEDDRVYPNIDPANWEFFEV